MKHLVPKTALTVITAAAALLAVPALASAAPLHVAAKHASKVSVSASPRVALAGTTVKLSGTVNSANPKPSGSITFWWGKHKLCSAKLANRSAHCNTSFHTAGNYGVRGVYSGDARHKSATGSVTVVATKAGTSTSVSVSTSRPTTVQRGTFTAAVSSHSPLGVTGTVRFLNGKTTLCSGAVSRGKASCGYTFTKAGSYKVTASYPGDGAHFGSSRTSGTITVTTPPPPPPPAASPTTTTITGFSKNPVNPTGDTTIVTVTVTSATGTPTGKVTVDATGGAAGLLGCTATLTSGTGSCTITTVAPASGLPPFGPIPFAASYGGDATHATSTSAKSTLEILAPTTTTVAFDAGTDMLTATVANPTNNNISPTAGGTGTVTFSIGGTAIAGCTGVPLTFTATGGTGATATGTNTATCAYTPGTAAVTVTATYSGDGSNVGSAGTVDVPAGGGA